MEPAAFWLARSTNCAKIHFNPYNNPVVQVLLSPFCMRGSLSTERLDNFSEVMQLSSGRADTEPRWSDSRVCAVNLYAYCWRTTC